MVLNFNMHQFDLNLLDGRSTTNGTTNGQGKKKKTVDDVLSVRFSSVAVSLLQKTQSQKVTFRLKTMNIFDPMCHPERMDHRILSQRATRKRNVAPGEHTNTSAEADANAANSDEALAATSSKEEKVLLLLEVEMFAKGSGTTDASIYMVSGPLELVYSPSCLNRVGAVFALPLELEEGVDQMVADLNALTSLEIKAKAKMEHAMANMPHRFR